MKNQMVRREPAELEPDRPDLPEVTKGSVSLTERFQLLMVIAIVVAMREEAQKQQDEAKPSADPAPVQIPSSPKAERPVLWYKLAVLLICSITILGIVRSSNVTNAVLCATIAISITGALVEILRKK